MSFALAVMPGGMPSGNHRRLLLLEALADSIRQVEGANFLR